MRNLYLILCVYNSTVSKENTIGVSGPPGYWVEFLPPAPIDNGGCAPHYRGQ